MASMTLRRAALALEFAVLFFGLPLCFVFRVVPVPLLVGLWGIAGACLAALLLTPGFERRLLWNPDRLSGRAALALGPALAAAPVILAATWLVDPDLLFRLARERPLLWAAVMVLYPVLSVYPQGVVYRVFLFHRYRELFPGRWPMILASAVAFSFAHVVFQNWIAPTFTLAGGLLFAWTYDRTRSALVASVQHAALGCVIFTSGLGWYFYAGSLR